MESPTLNGHATADQPERPETPVADPPALTAPAPLALASTTPARRPGAPDGNRNALKTGARMDVYRLGVGDMDKRFARVERAARAYRRDLEDVCQAVHDGVSVTQAHLIDLAVASETHAGICRWLLRHRLEKLSSMEVISCSAAIIKAKEARNRAIRELKLDPGPQDPVLAARARVLSAAEIEHYDRLYGEPVETPGRAHGDGTAQQTTQTPSAREASPEKRREGDGQ